MKYYTAKWDSEWPGEDVRQAAPLASTDSGGLSCSTSGSVGQATQVSCRVKKRAAPTLSRAP